MDAELAKLQNEGWNLNAEAVRKVHDQRENPGDTVLQTVLNTDLIGVPSLPADINRVDAKKLNDPIVLQVSTITDASLPSKLQETADGGSSKTRLLFLTLTDGKQKCSAMEYQPLDSIKKDNVIPGTKLRLHGCTVRLGIILLTSKTIKVLGGRVEELAESYEVQQRYGGSAERGTGDTDVQPPPKFQHYDPKKAGRKMPEKTTKFDGQKHRQKPGAAPPGSTQDAAGAPPPPPPPGIGKGGRPGNSAGAAVENPAEPAVVVAPTRETDVSAATALPGGGVAKSKLLERLQANTNDTGYRRGGGRGPRKGRRGRFDDDDDPNSMTLEEYEAQQKPKITLSSAKPLSDYSATSTQQLTDEELARKLQNELDLEDDHDDGGAADDLQASLLTGMFSYEREEPSSHRGRGRGGRRGGRGGGGRGRGSRGGGSSNRGRGRGDVDGGSRGRSRGRGRGRS